MQLFLLTLLLTLIIITGSCNLFDSKQSKTDAGKSTNTEEKILFTGVKPFYSNGILEKEVSYVDGVRNGVTKTYYKSGRLKQSFYYIEGQRSDTAKWFYEDGKLFRSTPYLNDTIHGTQVQYYRSGRVKASMSYVNGNRLPDLKEYYDNGKIKVFKREIVIKTRDEYAERTVFKIFAELNNKSTPVVFFRGELTDGQFNAANVTRIATSGGTGFLELMKGPQQNNGYVGIIAEYTTDFGNKNYLYKAVKVPYRDVY